MFDWDVHNLRKIRAHQVTREEAEEALANEATMRFPSTKRTSKAKCALFTMAKPARAACLL